MPGRNGGPPILTAGNRKLNLTGCGSGSARRVLRDHRQYGGDVMLNADVILNAAVLAMISLGRSR
jgi:hypothetical protein